MNKYAVEVQKMQKAALEEVQARLRNLRREHGHTKTAEEVTEIERLELQETELKIALADQ